MFKIDSLSGVRNYGVPALAGLAMTTLVGCGNGSSAIENLSAVQSGQAIDGYIVGGAVYCDGIRNGQTVASGRFSCPANTDLVRIRGGSDVGFDESAVGGGTPFIGELKAPGGSRYVTPLSTLATNIASADGELDARSYAQAVDTLAVSLSLPGLDLDDNPVSNIELAKANAKVNQLVASFAGDTDEYTRVTEQLAVVLDTSNSFDFSTDTAVMVSALNEQLTVEEPMLAMQVLEQAETISQLESTNAEIDRALSVDQIDVVVEQNVVTQSHAFSINKSAGLVRFVGPSTLFGTYSNLYDFQNATLFETGYKVRNNADTERVEFLTSGFTIKKTLVNEPVDAAIEFVSTTPGDNRRMSVTMSNAKLTMAENNSNSVRLAVPDDNIVYTTAVNVDGVVTNVTSIAGQDYFASSEDGMFSFSMGGLENELASRGYYNFTREAGNYKVTLVIDGVSFGVDSGTAETPARQYTISTSVQTVTGNGIQGYFTTE